MDFTAIDFETANYRRDSACQLAAVVVRSGKIVKRQKWMIRPRPFYFSPRNMEVHGIRPNDVAKVPEFGELWPSIAPFLQDTCLVAHNASFDIGVLVECLRSHQLESPQLHFTCTYLISRAAWPGQSGYGLKRVAERLGIEFRHHDALEDSVACAKILLAAAKMSGATTLESLESQFRLVRGQASSAGYQGAKRATKASKASARVSTSLAADVNQVAEAHEAYSPKSRSQDQADEIDLQRLMIRAGFLKRLSGQRVVFVGRLKRLSQVDAEQLAICLGASLQTQVTSETDLLVFGGEDTDRDSDPESDLARKELRIGDATVVAERLKAEGSRIRSITEDEFVALV